MPLALIRLQAAHAEVVMLLVGVEAFIGPEPRSLLRWVGEGLHLQVLEQSGIVQTEKVGRVRTSSIAPGGLDAAIGWLQARRTPAERRLDRLASVLEAAAGPEDAPHG